MPIWCLRSAHIAIVSGNLFSCDSLTGIHHASWTGARFRWVTVIIAG